MERGLGRRAEDNPREVALAIYLLGMPAALNGNDDQHGRPGRHQNSTAQRMPSRPHGAIAARPWRLRGRRCRPPLSHGRRAVDAPPRLRAQAYVVLLLPYAPTTRSHPTRPPCE